VVTEAKQQHKLAAGDKGTNGQSYRGNTYRRKSSSTKIAEKCKSLQEEWEAILSIRKREYEGSASQ
jgi:hypothetical protein